MRKLATVDIVREKSPIADADRIEIVHVRGWQCVAKKGEFEVGDICVYFEIDSFLPLEERFEFLRKSCYRKMAGKEGFRLKTARFRGAISQGLALPVSSFPEISDQDIGSDVTDLLGVVKFEPPIPACLGGQVEGVFPSFLTKTDQDRVQNIFLFEKDKDKEDFWEVTVKMDGASGTFYHNDGKFGVCSRNWELKPTEGNTFWSLADRYDLARRLSEMGNYAIQGEVCGEGIQKNRDKIKGHDLFVFDVFDINSHRYLTPVERHDFIKALNGIGGLEVKHVPVLWVRQLLVEFTSVEKILKLASGEGYNSSRREGIVCKSIPRNGERVRSFKVISNEYLLKTDG